MNKLLDIIITHYNEPWEVTSQGLFVLKYQKCVDFNQIRVILIHDGSEPFEELKNMSFPFDFLEITIPHGGVSSARNHGINISDAEWITFCDCDDFYSSLYSLKRVLEGLNDYGRFDMLWGPYYIEENGQLANEQFNLVWIHNKYYRLSFLNRHHVRFNEDLDICEDGAFNMLTYLEMKENRIGEIKCQEPLYVWCRRQNSTTTDKRNLMKITRGVLERDIYVSYLFRERYRPTTGLMMGRTITDAYATLQQKRVEPYEEEIMDICKMIREFWDECEEYLHHLTDEQWQYVLEASEKECRDKGVLNPDRLSLDEWLEKKLGVKR